MDLADIDKEPVKLDYSCGQEGAEPFFPWKLAQKGEMLYTSANGEDGSQYIVEMNLSTGAGRILAEFHNTISVAERHFTIYGNEALIKITDYATWKTWLYRLDLETGEMTGVAHDGERAHLWSELDPKAGFIYGNAQSGSRYGEWTFCASDLNGDELWRIGEEGLPEGIDTLVISFITEDYIFFHDKNDGNCLNILPKWYVEKSAVGTDHFEIKVWEP